MTENMFPASGAIVSLGGLFLNIKHGQLFHRKDLSTEEKYQHYQGAMRTGSVHFGDDKKHKIYNVMLDEVIGTLLIILGTIIWAYG